MKRSKTAFPKGYGIFPYIIIKMGSARYIQVPIRRLSKSDSSRLKGVFTIYEDETGITVYRERNLNALLQIRDDHYDKHQIYLLMCLVQGKRDALYVNEAGEITESDAIPTGGVLLTGDHKILSMSGKHYVTSVKTK